MAGRSIITAANPSTSSAVNSGVSSDPIDHIAGYQLTAYAAAATVAGNSAARPGRTRLATRVVQREGEEPEGADQARNRGGTNQGQGTHRAAEALNPRTVAPRRGAG